MSPFTSFGAGTDSVLFLRSRIENVKPSRASVHAAAPVMTTSAGNPLSSFGSYTVFVGFGPRSVNPTTDSGLASEPASSVCFVTTNAVVSSFHTTER